MGVKTAKSSVSLTKFFMKAQGIIESEIKKVLYRLGEECNTKIRDRSAQESWNDITGNLRSSIGYAVYKRGVIEMESAFSMVKSGTEGAAKGKELIKNLADIYVDTYVLVVLAGMNYADDVERRDNKDVLASAELWAKSVISKRMEKAKEKAINRINKLVI